MVTVQTLLAQHSGVNYLTRFIHVSGPATELRRYAEDVRAGTGTDFVVIMSPDGIRYTHPDPSQITQVYHGDPRYDPRNR